MLNLKNFEAWFVTSSQHLYGSEVLEKVADHSKEITQGLTQSPDVSVKVVFKPVLTTPEAIYALYLEANAAPQLHRSDHLDAHLFPGQDVDCGPDLKTAAGVWILAGAAHHTGFSQAVTTAPHLEDFAEIAGLEFPQINRDTWLPEFKKELRWNEVYYYLSKGL